MHEYITAHHVQLTEGELAAALRRVEGVAFTVGEKVCLQEMDHEPHHLCVIKWSGDPELTLDSMGRLMGLAPTTTNRA